jgi:hypothetical protein
LCADRGYIGFSTIKEAVLLKTYLLICLMAVLVFGCAQNRGNPAMPGVSDDPSTSGNLETTTGREISFHNPHKLWAAGNLYFSSDHDSVELIPFRMGGIHLNVLRFFEESGDNCVLITGLQDNYDGTINLTMEITHPYPGHLELTGFDPKLILMFQGSHVIPAPIANMKPLYSLDYRLSWRLMGDPEILNADGYTYYWCPDYDSGLPHPIFNYWEGKYAFGGTPTANINAYLDFYSNEERHMLEAGAAVSRAFHISLPSGPWRAGYALDVCWEIPTVMPVTNPVDDFPFSANQPELFHFKVVYNNGLVITDPSCCNHYGSPPSTIEEGYVELDLWYLLPDAIEKRMVGFRCEAFYKTSSLTGDCDSPDPEHVRCAPGFKFSSVPDGIYQVLAHEIHSETHAFQPVPYPSFDVFEVEIDCD